MPQPPRCLYLIGGVFGVGKSTLADRLGHALYRPGRPLPWVHSTDDTRVALWEVVPPSNRRLHQQLLDTKKGIERGGEEWGEFLKHPVTRAYYDERRRRQSQEVWRGVLAEIRHRLATTDNHLIIEGIAVLPEEALALKVEVANRWPDVQVIIIFLVNTDPDIERLMADKARPEHWMHGWPLERVIGHSGLGAYTSRLTLEEAQCLGLTVIDMGRRDYATNMDRAFAHFLA